jgi:hypothetical protein
MIPPLLDILLFSPSSPGIHNLGAFPLYMVKLITQSSSQVTESSTSLSPPVVLFYSTEFYNIVPVHFLTPLLSWNFPDVVVQAKYDLAYHIYLSLSSYFILACLFFLQLRFQFLYLIFCSSFHLHHLSYLTSFSMNPCLHFLS